MGAKDLKIKGIVGAASAALALLSYVGYYFAFYNYNTRLDELFFIGTGVSISLSFGLLFTFFQNKAVRALTLFCSVFYFILVNIYVVCGLITGNYYAHIKLSLTIGLAAGLLYLAYDTLDNRRRNGV